MRSIRTRVHPSFHKKLKKEAAEIGVPMVKYTEMISKNCTTEKEFKKKNAKTFMFKW